MTSADVPIERTLFVRKATGLVKGWSVLDAFIYAAFAINLMALGFGYAFTTIAFIPDSALIGAIVLWLCSSSSRWLVYASLIAVMPRAGGDYVWQSRMLAAGIGFVFAGTGWSFILWHWVPIYANILVWSRYPADHGHHRQHRDRRRRVGLVASTDGRARHGLSSWRRC